MISLQPLRTIQPPIQACLVTDLAIVIDTFRVFYLDTYIHVLVLLCVVV